MATTESRIDTNISKLESQLQVWSKKLDEAKAKASDASRKQLDELALKLKAAQKKLDEAKAAGGEKWETVKEGVEHVWKEVEGTFKKLIH